MNTQPVGHTSRRGGVAAANYIRHIPNHEFTWCGRVPSQVNCIVLGEDETVEDICVQCRARRIPQADVDALESFYATQRYTFSVVSGQGSRRVSLVADTRSLVARHLGELAAVERPVVYQRDGLTWRVCRPQPKAASPRLRVDLEPDAVFGWSWRVYRGNQAICSGLTDDSNSKSVARREALAAAAICEGPAGAGT